MELQAKEINSIRTQLGLNREQFAQLINVSYKTISRWEKEGIRSLSNSSSDKLIELKKILEKKEGAFIIRKILKTTPLIAGIAGVATLIPILGPIFRLNANSISFPLVIKALKDLIDYRELQK